MSEYIEKALADRELCDLIRKYNRACDSDASRGAFEALGYIRQLPTADVNNIVRCDGCRYHRDNGYHICDKLKIRLPNDSEFFCAYGKRKEYAYMRNQEGDTP